MGSPGRVLRCDLGDGQAVEIWDGGDPSGRPLVVHPGTPATHIMGRWGHEAAHQARVRLIAVSRPGYAASTPRETPSLRAVGEDAAALARALGLNGYGVLGISGGGPFALATAVADPDGVRALGVVGGIGPWGYACQRASTGPGVPGLVGREPRRPPRQPRGIRLRHLAWGGPWDVDRRDVMVPTIVIDTDQPDAHGSWYAEGIQGADLVIHAGESHLDICDGHWPEVLASLLRMWR